MSALEAPDDDDSFSSTDMGQSCGGRAIKIIKKRCGYYLGDYLK